MLSADEIVAQLQATATAEVRVAIGWHVALLFGALAWWRGWRPSRRTAGRLIALLPASAAVVAAAHGNPFNAVLLGALALVLLAARGATGLAGPASLVALVPGLVLFALGVCYPEFVEGSPLRVVYAAPVGVLPCPTLYTALGLALLMNPPGRAWADTLAAVALFYGLFGVGRLGVRIDVGLVLGALVLIAVGLMYRARPPRRPSATH